MGAGDGHKLWIFPDGDLPPAGQPGLPLEGHESLIVLNTGDEDAHIEIDVFFSDSDPVEGLRVKVPARRVRVFRIDKPLGEQAFDIPFGQYSLRLRSNVNIIAQLGRADVRQPNLAYYTVMGFSAD